MTDSPEDSPVPVAFRRSHHAQPWNATSAAAWWGEAPGEDDPLPTLALRAVSAGAPAPRPGHA